MKSVLLLIACTFLFPIAVATQQKKPAHDVFVIGSRSVRVPAPEGFTNGFESIPELTRHMKSLDGPEGKKIAVHIPHAVAAKISGGEPVESLGFYTTVSVRDELTNVDVTPEMLADLAHRLESEIEPAIDAELPRAVAAGRKALTERWGRAAEVSLWRPINLGLIEKQPNALSLMMLTVIIKEGKQIPMLGVMGHVIVNKRLLYVNIYKELTADADASTVRDFTKKWIAAIIAANENHN